MPPERRSDRVGHKARSCGRQVLMAALVALAGCDPTSLAYLENGQRRDAALADASRADTTVPDARAARLDTGGDTQASEASPPGVDTNVEAGGLDGAASDAPLDNPVDPTAQDGGGGEQGEAGAIDAGGGAWDTAALDGGGDGAPDAPPDGGADAADVPRGCRGVADSGICWYLARSSESCASTCAAHGGTSPAAAGHVGTASQGGVARECYRLLDLVTSPGLEVTDSRSGDDGLGCYVSLLGLHVWLSSPSYDPSATLLGAQPLCGCME